jgi:hypothetical protein
MKKRKSLNKKKVYKHFQKHKARKNQRKRVNRNPQKYKKYKVCKNLNNKLNKMQYSCLKSQNNKPHDINNIPTIK